MEKGVKLIRLEIHPKTIKEIFSNGFKTKFTNPIPKDSILFSVEYNEKSKKLNLYFLSQEKGFSIEEDFVESYKNRIVAWDLTNK
jgi:hypothetical protein